jgi:transcriptional regulator with XRE-family HTH domain
VSESTRFEESRQALADRVRALRAERGLSQEALAHEAGIDRTYASQIERGVGNPSLKVLCAIATALNIELDVLLRA